MQTLIADDNTVQCVVSISTELQTAWTRQVVQAGPVGAPGKGLDLLEQAAQYLEVRRLAAVLITARLQIDEEK